MILVGIIVLLLIISIGIKSKQHQEKRELQSGQGIRVYGVVIRVIDTSSSNMDSRSYRARIRWKDRAGQQHDLLCYMGPRRTYKNGDTVPIIYNPRNPQSAFIDK